MKKENDVFETYSQINNMLDSINMENNNEKIENNKKVENNIIKNNEEFIPILSEENKDELVNKIELDENVVTQEKVNNKRKKKSKCKKWIITFGILDLVAIICLFLMYGPISYFRNLWVTSAMTTMTHKYLAYIFFNQEQIDKIMANNIVIEVDDNTNVEEIQIQEIEDQVVYSSLEEEQILKKDEGNDLYKIIKVEGKGYKGHLLVVYDSSKVQLAQTPNARYGLTIDEFVQKNNAVAAINAGGFNYSSSYGYSPTGVFILDGEIISDGGSTGWGGGIIGFTNDNILVLTKVSAYEAVRMGVRDAVSFGPFLIVNGVASEFKGNGGYGIAPRTAIGQRKDGIVLMLVIDGRRPGHSLGVDMVELTNIMLKYGAYNAANLDGGGSSSIAVGNKILNVAGGSGYSGDRYLPNAWLVMP